MTPGIKALEAIREKCSGGVVVHSLSNLQDADLSSECLSMLINWK